MRRQDRVLYLPQWAVLGQRLDLKDVQARPRNALLLQRGGARRRVDDPAPEPRRELDPVRSGQRELGALPPLDDQRDDQNRQPSRFQ